MLLCAAAWPAAAHAQGNLVVDPERYDFGGLVAGEAASGILEVWNDGSEQITLGSIGFEGAAGPFALGEGGCVAELVLDPGWGCDLEVGFVAPSVRGDHEAVVFVEADEGADVAFARVAGSSYVPGHLAAEPAALDLGVVARGSASRQRIVVRNAGDTPVAIGDAGFSPRGVRRFLASRDFKVDGTGCIGSLGGGATCEIVVVFQPYPPFPFPMAVGAATASQLRQVELHVLLQDHTVALTVPVKGVIPMVAPRPPPVPPQRIDYGAIEQNLVRLAEAVPRLMRGGPRRGRRLPSFTAPTAGRLSMQVREVGRQRRVRLAKGALKLESGQRGRLRFSLGNRARKLLRRARRTRVNVMVSFRARADGETFDQALELTVRRPAKRKAGKGG